MEIENVFLIGSGKVAQQIAFTLQQKKILIKGIYNRTPKHAEWLAKALHCQFYNEMSDIPTDANLYLLCVSDQAITNVSSNLIENSGIVAHVSGATSIDVIDKKHKRRGVVYPLQTFTMKNRVNFRHVPILIETNNDSDTFLLVRMAKKISDIVIEMSESERKNIHLAATFVNNFSNCMFVIANSILQKKGLNFKLLLPLIQETVHNIKQCENPVDLQTGPAARKDMDTLKQHLELLNDQPELQNIYQIISNYIAAKTNI